MNKIKTPIALLVTFAVALQCLQNTALAQSTGDVVILQLASPTAFTERTINGVTQAGKPLGFNAAGTLTAIPITVSDAGVITGATFSGTLGAISGANLTTLNATQLLSGTIPDARFPATLPALSGLNLTLLNADNIASGTLPDGRFPATLPIASGVNLTALNATNLASGTIPDARFPATLPALSGVNLTALNAANLASGTIPSARFPATLPAASGANLTALNATQLTSGTIPEARLLTAEADVASASTVDLGAQSSKNLRITGTTAITAFGTATAGTMRWVRFAGSLTLTHNATSLIIPGGSNITTAANDRFCAFSLGSGNWLVYDYMKADGTAIVGAVGGGDVSSNTASSLDNEIALFSGTGGKTIKRASTTGLLKGTSGAISAAVAGTDYLEPAGSGASLTALNATQLTSGTIPDARFPATLPAASGVNLTALNASNLASGTVPDARFPATLPAASGVNLTALNATQLTSGTVPEARLITAEASVASAATVDLGAQTTRNVQITGTTTITSFGTATAGTMRWVRFAAALTLTHNATSLILPGVTSITTAANDRLSALSLGSGNWLVYNYERADGTSLAVSATAATAASAFATDNRVVRSDGTGRGLQASGWSLLDTDVLSVSGTTSSISVSGTGSALTGISSTVSGSTSTAILGTASGSATNGVWGNADVSGGYGVRATASDAGAYSLAVENIGGFLARINFLGTASRDFDLPDTAGTFLVDADIGVTTQAYSENLDGFAALPVPLSDPVGRTDAVTIENKTFKASQHYTDKHSGVGVGATETIDVTIPVHEIILDANVTLTFGSWVASVHEQRFLLRVIQNGTGGWTISYAAGSAPTSTPAYSTTAGDMTEILFKSTDGGTTIEAISSLLDDTDLETAEVDVASATTTNIGAVSSRNVRITGTTTITGLGTAAAGRMRWGRFAGALTFTHNATSLILPGGANITTAAGDAFTAESLGGGNWKILHYSKADGTAVVGAAGGGDASTNTASSVDDEIVLFSGTGGKTLKRATTTGLLKGTSGVISAAAAGTDYLAPSGSGAALTALNATQITSGTLPDARLTQAEADLASAATTDIGAQTTPNVRITGTTTITSFGTVAAGTRRYLRFAGSLALTYNATALILPGSSSIQTEANDRATAMSLGSGNWIVTDYTRTSGFPLVIEPSSISSSAIINGTVAGNDLVNNLRVDEIVASVDGGGSAITAGEIGTPIYMNYSGAITGWTVSADQAGSIVFDIWKEADSYDAGGVMDNAPAVADTIVNAGTKPTLSSQRAKHSTTLTSWTTTFAAGDTIIINVDSASTLTRAKLILHTLRD
jgi:hypothetical protein